MSDPDAGGIGTPSTSRPGFVPPDTAPLAPASAPRPAPPGAPDALPGPVGWTSSSQPSAWAPPNAAERFDDRTPVGRAPRRSRRGRRTVVAATLAGALLLVGLLSALPMLPSAAPGAAVSSTPSASPVLVTATPSPMAVASTTVSNGGDLGRAVGFRTATGAGEVTVSTVAWTDAGQATPPAGQRYLVVTLSVACTSGSVAVDPILLLASTSRGAVLPGFGPTLSRPLGGRLLRAGESVTGQVGYAVTPGAVRIALLDEDLRPLAGVEIPAP